MQWTYQGLVCEKLLVRRVMLLDGRGGRLCKKFLICSKIRAEEAMH